MQCETCGHWKPESIRDATLEWIEALIEVGWEVSYVPRIKQFQWRSPKGISGSDHQTREMEKFPPAVVAYIRENFRRSAV